MASSLVIGVAVAVLKVGARRVAGRLPATPELAYEAALGFAQNLVSGFDTVEVPQLGQMGEFAHSVAGDLVGCFDAVKMPQLEQIGEFARSGFAYINDEPLANASVIWPVGAAVGAVAGAVVVKAAKTMIDTVQTRKRSAEAMGNDEEEMRIARRISAVEAGGERVTAAAERVGTVGGAGGERDTATAERVGMMASPLTPSPLPRTPERELERHLDDGGDGGGDGGACTFAEVLENFKYEEEMTIAQHISAAEAGGERVTAAAERVGTVGGAGGERNTATAERVGMMASPLPPSLSQEQQILPQPHQQTQHKHQHEPQMTHVPAAEQASRVPRCVLFLCRVPSKNLEFDDDGVPVGIQGIKCRKATVGTLVVIYSKGPTGSVKFIARAGEATRSQGHRFRPLLDVRAVHGGIGYEELKLASNVQNLHDGHEVMDKHMVSRLQATWHSELLTSESDGSSEASDSDSSSETSDSDYVESELSSD
jgi:hypothetical protein